MTVCFIGKKGDRFAEMALEQLRHRAIVSNAVTGIRPDRMPVEMLGWSGDILISYLAPWVIPASVLERFRLAINFHPGSPEYPGIGCTNFAIYESAKRYGVTCHKMAAGVDTGEILGVRRFPVAHNETVWSLTRRSYEQMFMLYNSLLPRVLAGEQIVCNEKWKRKAFRREELEDLRELRADMPVAEKERRVRALTFPGMPGAYPA